MEELLELYAQPYAAEAPVVCFDEASKQLVAETRTPLPLEPGQPVRYDYEYARNGVVNLFMLFQPLAGWRHVEVTERRTAQEFAHQMKALVDVHFPEAEQIHVVLDNLNTHTKGSLYETFAPEEAKRLSDRLVFHYTPKHGSWLNMAEMELGILQQQCLDRRIPAAEIVVAEAGAWERDRNARRATVRWRFNVTNARTKLKRLYPVPS